MVRTRFAPSPTGVLHLGSIRTALFCWLYARRYDGRFVLRIEDTDRERSTDENVDAITEGMAWLGLDADEGPIFQSHRMQRYKEVIDQWLRDGKAYHCYCSKERLDEIRQQQMATGERVRYDGRCRDGRAEQTTSTPVVRFRNPTEGQVEVQDAIRGRVTFDNQQLDDLIIARSDGSPTYNFTVVVDDSDMQITHVIRGDDHLNNTPRQINMLKALGAELPTFAHVPMILGADGAKLSKRHGAVDIRDYRDQGYLPEAMLNYLVRLGWSHGDQELFSVDQMIELFDIHDVNQSASSFNPDKLTWLNQQHIIAMPADRLGRELLPFLRRIGVNPDDGPDPALVADGYRERAPTLLHMAEQSRYCYASIGSIDEKIAKKVLRPVTLEPLRSVRDELASLEEWTAPAIDAAIRGVADRLEVSLGKIGQPVRVAVTGGGVSPPIDVTCFLVGQNRSVRRLGRAIDYVVQRAGQ